MPISLNDASKTGFGDPGTAVSDLTLDAHHLRRCYREVRRTTTALCEPLDAEDHLVQSMPDASPAKWHLAHTSWFFETFVLAPHLPGYEPFDPRFGYLFNSYYNAVGERIARDRRGLITRPNMAEVYRYRAAVDERIAELLDRSSGESLARFRSTLILGLHHEQQHQELILTDIKHALSCNPLAPCYRNQGRGQEATDDAQAPDAGPGKAAPASDRGGGGSGHAAETADGWERSAGSRPVGRGDVREAPGWVAFPAGIRAIGHQGPRFSFDNETPRHRQFVDSFALADRLVTNREYQEFIDDGGYDRPEFWLSDGWAARHRLGWTAPLYWLSEGRPHAFTLEGVKPLAPDEPVCHVSYYEADAFARWAGARLATEAEWEVAAVESGAANAIEGNFLETQWLHPRPVAEGGVTARRSTPAQLFGDVWEWTASPYTPYRGFRPAPGALGEYNGKFMCNQMVLRGGSCASPRSHLRVTYRNFFSPEARWQFSGIRLARDI